MRPVALVHVPATSGYRNFSASWIQTIQHSHPAHEKGKAILSTRLHVGNSIALTTDVWKSEAMKAFATITGHFVHDWWTLVS